MLPSSGILVVVGVIKSAAIGAAAPAKYFQLSLANCIGLVMAACAPEDNRLLVDGTTGAAPAATLALSAKLERPSAPKPAF